MAKNELIALSLLYGGPKHAYAINMVMKDIGFEDWSTVSKASIYNCLKRLEKSGHVEVFTEKVGNMPERNVYSITQLGQEALRGEMIEALTVHEKNFERLYLALVFGLGITGEEMIDFLNKKKEKIAELIEIQKDHASHEHYEEYNIPHPKYLIQSGIMQLESIIWLIDRILEILKIDPDYYSKSYTICKNLYEKKEL
ncbi:MAG: PadR family transcriptional regulator [Candidatus Delongbacteria bacterium]|nr:PadR family transcriptional regulator [Candidatus Delongbacteria bacterium]MBN2833866.1 PadR family transcriptional regulator [Candidatus Delongbacteria bacterium]